MATAERDAYLWVSQAHHVVRSDCPGASRRAGQGDVLPGSHPRALREEMVRDERVFLMGEDIAKHGGAFGVTRTLFDQFGPERVRNTPISENTLWAPAPGPPSRHAPGDGDHVR